MTRVYADMVGDLFHHGHVEFLRRARDLGDELVVGVHSDATAESYKRTPVMTMDERVRVVEACRRAIAAWAKRPRHATVCCTLGKQARRPQDRAECKSLSRLL